VVRPLTGITVVALEQAVATPFASRQLADLGARVIKIERPGAGDFARGYDETVKGLSSHFVWLNRSKESLTLDLKREEGKAVLHRLLEGADVFMQNLAPGAAERLGFGAGALRARHPALIVCNLSGYGSSGPYRDKKAYDLLVQAEAGLLSITGSEEVPSKAGISVADIAGGMYAFSGVLTALYHRANSGEGTVIEVSLFEALAEWMGYPAYYTLYGGSAPPRSGAMHATIAPYGPFATGDGKHILLGIQNEREWRRFCGLVLGRPDLAGDPRFKGNAERVRNREALHEVIAGVFAGLALEGVEARLAEAAIAHAQMRTVDEFLAHPSLAARGRWAEVASPVGPLKTLLPPVMMAGAEAVLGPIPEVGEHTETILAELGYSEEGIAELRRVGVI
jgi:crotonobetainyl-CoA:carnitine CoA-transferase CaiB-like acyl-CoA transferase